MSTLKVNNITDTSGGSTNLTVPNTAKAWVNFNGTGTVAIRASYNVSSITDNGVGDYTVNFTTALVDANFAWTANVGLPTDSTEAAVFERSDFRTSSALRIKTRNSPGTQVDREYCHVLIFR
jgi:hypothetical protein